MKRRRGYRVKAEMVRTLREAQFLSHEELAAKAGVSEATIRRIESGRTEGSHRPTLRSIAEALGVSVKEIIEIEPAPEFQGGFAFAFGV